MESPYRSRKGSSKLTVRPLPRYADGTPKYSPGELEVGDDAPDFEVAWLPLASGDLQQVRATDLRRGMLLEALRAAQLEQGGGHRHLCLDFGSFS